YVPLGLRDRIISVYCLLQEANFWKYLGISETVAFPSDNLIVGISKISYGNIIILFVAACTII
ncbi:MAG: hypothetical protein KAT71_07555, partial [Gammaproteobacteria bacterium]|nr:hypothetical protein [Gammaproteobacteria bacterium]